MDEQIIEPGYPFRSGKTHSPAIKCISRKIFQNRNRDQNRKTRETISIWIYKGRETSGGLTVFQSGADKAGHLGIGVGFELEVVLPVDFGGVPVAQFV